MSLRRILVATILLCVSIVGGLPEPPPAAFAQVPKNKGVAKDIQPIPMTLIEDAVIHGATFQSHNQKIVRNRRGIFATYIKNRNEDYMGQEWRLAVSTDGGDSFRTLFTETAATNPPILETDADDNLYVVRPDFVDRHAYLYRFLAKNDYKEPSKSQIPRGSGGKYAMAIDAHRSQLYYCSHNRTFHIIGLDGEARSSIELFKPGRNAVIAYPYVCMAADHTLYVAWTTVAVGKAAEEVGHKHIYWDIHVMRSRDGGEHWEKLDGTPLKTPVEDDDLGPTDRVTADDEFKYSTWLSNFLPVGDKLHFVYSAFGKPGTPPRERYVRYDRTNGRKDHEIAPAFKGETLSLLGLDGFFAVSPDGASLYCVVKDATASRLACLRSDDAGRTWHDYAVGPLVVNPYAIGGCRTVTADGWIIGTFTDAIEVSAAPEGKSKVFFFKIKAAP